MYDTAINALMDNEPERAIQEIHRVMATRAISENQLELSLSISDEIIRATDFLESHGWIA